MIDHRLREGEQDRLVLLDDRERFLIAYTEMAPVIEQTGAFKIIRRGTSAAPSDPSCR
jgi:hypothetical protein